MSKTQIEVFPLTHVMVGKIPVQANKNRGDVKKGVQYYLTAVYQDGRVTVMEVDGLHPMDLFNKVIAEAANDNAPKK